MTKFSIDNLVTITRFLVAFSSHYVDEKDFIKHLRLMLKLHWDSIECEQLVTKLELLVSPEQKIFYNFFIPCIKIFSKNVIPYDKFEKHLISYLILNCEFLEKDL